MATIFSRIIAGEIPCYKIAENDRFFAFLDINPLVKGHTLVVPKQEVDYIFDLSDEDLAAMHVFAKKIARAIEKAFPCKKVGEAVIGLEVPHIICEKNVSYPLIIFCFSGILNGYAE